MIRINFRPLCCGDSLDSRKFLDPATGYIISAGINTLAGAGAGLASGLGSRANRHEARRQFNVSMQQHQIDQQMAYDYANMDWQRNRQAALEDWQRETKYNSAAAVAARYRAAGLNPALMMQGSSAAQASMNAPSSVSPGASSQSASPTATMPDPSGLGNTIAQAGNALRQSVSDYFDFKIKEQQAKQLGIENDHLDQKFIAEIMNMRQEYQNKLSDQSLTRTQRQLYERQIDIMDEQIFNMTQMRDVKLRQDFDQARQVGIMNDNLLLEGRKLNVEADIAETIAKDKAFADLKLTQANIASVAQGIVESKARTKEAIANEAFTIMQKNNIDPSTVAGHRLQKEIESRIYANTGHGAIAGWRAYQDITNMPIGSSAPPNARKHWYDY